MGLATNERGEGQGALLEGVQPANPCVDRAVATLVPKEGFGPADLHRLLHQQLGWRMAARSPRQVQVSWRTDPQHVAPVHALTHAPNVRDGGPSGMMGHGVW